MDSFFFRLVHAYDRFQCNVEVGCAMTIFVVLHLLKAETWMRRPLMDNDGDYRVDGLIWACELFLWSKEGRAKYLNIKYQTSRIAHTINCLLQA